MTRRTKNVILSLLLGLILITVLVLQNPTEAKAASQKTLRVTTEKQLKAALKDSNVKTIILRTSSYKDITIKSSKAKQKKIIIDAPNASVTNKARFKKVKVVRAKEYFEAVSGNTLNLSSNVHLQVTEGVSVKKLAFTEAPIYYDIQKNGSIKNIVIADKNHKSTFNKETRTLIFDTVGTWTSYDSDYYGTTENLVTEEYPIHYTLVLDESGRRLSSSYTGWATEKCNEYKYDENGNCVEWKEYDAGSGDLKPSMYFEYVYDGNRLVKEIDHSYDPDTVTYEKIYDKYGKLAETHDSGSYFSEDTIYTYDDKGFIISENTTKMWFSNDNRLESRKSWTTTYTYDKNGFLLVLEKELIDEHTKNIVTYEYDKDNNLIHESRVSKMPMREGEELTINEFDIFGMNTINMA